MNRETFDVDTGSSGEWKDIALNILEIGDTRSAASGDNDLVTNHGNDPGSLMSVGNEGFDDVSSMYSKLEVMMTAVRQEVSGLESMKSKLKDIGKLKEKLSINRDKLKSSEQDVKALKKQLQESDAIIKQFRMDMQHLNNIYNEERSKHIESQAMYSRQEEALQHAQIELRKIQTDMQSSVEQQNMIKKLKSQLSKLGESKSQDQANFLQKIFTLERKNEENEKIKTELGSHVWNLTEEIKELKSTQEKSEIVLKKLRGQLLQTNDEEFTLKESVQKLVLAQQEAQKSADDFKVLTNIKVNVLLSDINDLKEVIEMKDFQFSSLAESQRNYCQIKNDYEQEINALESSIQLLKTRQVDLQTSFQLRMEEVQRMEMIHNEQSKCMSQKDKTIENLEIELIVSISRYLPDIFRVLFIMF